MTSKSEFLIGEGEVVYEVTFESNSSFESVAASVRETVHVVADDPLTGAMKAGVRHGLMHLGRYTSLHVLSAVRKNRSEVVL